MDKDIVLLGSGESGHMAWHENTMKELDDVFSIIDYHGYPEADLIKSGDLYDSILEKNQVVRKRGNQAIIISEAGVAPMDNLDSISYGINIVDYGIQALNAGVSGISTWSFDDNAYPKGFDTSMIKLDNFEARPWFKAWSLLSRGFPKNSIIYKSRAIDESVRYTIAKVPEGYRILMINQSSQDVSMRINIDDDNIYTFSHYIYGESDYKKDASLSSTQVVYDLNAPLLIKIPGHSLVLLTTLNYQVIGDK